MSNAHWVYNQTVKTFAAGAEPAFEDEGAQAVVLLINSPGGSPVQAGIDRKSVV